MVFVEFLDSTCKAAAGMIRIKGVCEAAGSYEKTGGADQKLSHPENVTMSRKKNVNFGATQDEAPDDVSKLKIRKKSRSQVCAE